MRSTPCGGLALKTDRTGQDQAWTSNTRLATEDGSMCVELEVAARKVAARIEVRSTR